MDLPRGRLAPFTPCAVGALQRAHAVTGERLAGACAPPRIRPIAGIEWAWVE